MNKELYKQLLDVLEKRIASGSLDETLETDFRKIADGVIQIMKEESTTNKFEQLVQDLVDGSLGFTHIQIAIRESIRRRKDIPEGAKDVLCGKGEASSGLIFKIFALIRQTIGGMELVHRRARDTDDVEM